MIIGAFLARQPSSASARNFMLALFTVISGLVLFIHPGIGSPAINTTPRYWQNTAIAFTAAETPV
jgi:uncharacterized membrane protein